jgi:hypothetical protein
MSVTKIVDEEKREHHQKQIIVALFSVCILGFSYLVYFYFNTVDRTSLPEDLAQVDQTINQWQLNGLVYSFDDAQAKLIVNEDLWDKMTREEKMGVITQLARYCSERKREQAWKFQVMGNRSSSVLGELGARGLVIR